MSSMHFRYCKKNEIDFPLCWLEMRNGVHKFLRYKLDGSSGMAVVNTLLFIHKNWIKSHGTSAVTQAVTCKPVVTPTYGVNFFSTSNAYFSV